MERGVLWIYVRRHLLALLAAIAAATLGFVYADGWLTSLWFSFVD